MKGSVIGHTVSSTLPNALTNWNLWGFLLKMNQAIHRWTILQITELLFSSVYCINCYLAIATMYSLLGIDWAEILLVPNGNCNVENKKVTACYHFLIYLACNKYLIILNKIWYLMWILLFWQSTTFKNHDCSWMLSSYLKIKISGYSRFYQRK